MEHSSSSRRHHNQSPLCRFQHKRPTHKPLFPFSLPTCHLATALSSYRTITLFGVVFEISHPAHLISASLRRSWIPQSYHLPVIQPSAFKVQRSVLPSVAVEIRNQKSEFTRPSCSSCLCVVYRRCRSNQQLSFIRSPRSPRVPSVACADGGSLRFIRPCRSLVSFVVCRCRRCRSNQNSETRAT